MPDNDDASKGTPLERFESLAKKLFSIAKKDVEKVEETVEEFAEEIIPPEKPMPDE